MASRDLIIKYFNDLGIEINEDDAVVDRCKYFKTDRL